MAEGRVTQVIGTVVDVEFPPEQMPAIESRFLFVAVASRRAKQLRKGALPRLKALRPDPAKSHSYSLAHMASVPW